VSDERIIVTGDEEAVRAWFEDHRLTDGLPIVPPTEERVAAMVSASGLPPGESLGAIPPSFGEATVEKLAANAVMAGLRPDRFPVVLAAVRAMLRPEFNLYGVQATTHPVAPLVVVHGPAARNLGVHGGAGALGPGFPANATIGRALRMVLLNVGGAYPGVGDLSTHGGPAKFTYCLTENVAASPWPEFHTRRGFAPTESAVTVFGGEAPHNVNDHQSSEPERLLGIVADVMGALGHNSWYSAADDGNDMVVLLSPEHAEAGALARSSVISSSARRDRWKTWRGAGCGRCATGPASWRLPPGGASRCPRYASLRESCSWLRAAPASTRW
jgi:hypothetical protein